MKVLLLFLIFVLPYLTACKQSGQSKLVAQDTMQKKSLDSSDYNPATPAAQNSDDPSRFAQ